MNRFIRFTLLGAGLFASACQIASTKETAADLNASKAFVVYHDGEFAWPGDYSYSATPTYRDKTGQPATGQYDIKVTLTGQWGGWQPFATNWVFDTTPYTHLRFALKPTVANQKAQVYFMLVGDKPVGVVVDPFKYGPPPEPGKWAVYTIPLLDIGVSKLKIYKFCIQDQTGLKENTFFVNDVAFVTPAGP